MRPKNGTAPAAAARCHGGSTRVGDTVAAVTKVTAMSSAHDLFRSGRDALLATATDYDRALATYEPPRPARFNWALDWFDVVAADPGDRRAPALRVIEDDGSDAVGDLRADVRPAPPRWPAGCAPTASARPPGAADARQPGRAVGDHARRDEARRGAHPGDDAAGRGRHRATGSSGAGSGTSSPRPASTSAFEQRARRLPPHRRRRQRRGLDRLPGGRAGRRGRPVRPDPERASTRGGRHRCCCTSPPARPR